MENGLAGQDIVIIYKPRRHRVALYASYRFEFGLIAGFLPAFGKGALVLVAAYKLNRNIFYFIVQRLHEYLSAHPVTQRNAWPKSPCRKQKNR